MTRINITGRLPSWVRSTANSLIGLAGTYWGKTKAQANQLASDSLNKVALGLIQSGQLQCIPSGASGGPPRPPLVRCIVGIPNTNIGDLTWALEPVDQQPGSSASGSGGVVSSSSDSRLIVVPPYIQDRTFNAITSSFLCVQEDYSINLHVDLNSTFNPSNPPVSFTGQQLIVRLYGGGGTDLTEFPSFLPGPGSYDITYNLTAGFGYSFRLYTTAGSSYNPNPPYQPNFGPDNYTFVTVTITPTSPP